MRAQMAEAEAERLAAEMHTTRQRSATQLQAMEDELATTKAEFEKKAAGLEV